MEQVDVLSAGAAQIIPADGLTEKIVHSVRTGVPLRVKLGLDPTAPDLHIGHTVVLHKLRAFQKYGHRIQLIIGDFTARIGDPTGKSVTRKPLTEEDVQRHAQTYRDQLARIIDIDRADIVYNAAWLQPLTLTDVVGLSAKVTVARMLERDDFQKRYATQQPIALHEFLYPLMQAYDSVHLGSDIELGGTDQTFNLLMGRVLQREYGAPPQVVMTMPLLPGTDGVHKMSKSLHNAICLLDLPRDMYGKTMSIPDALLEDMMRLAAGMTRAEVDLWIDGVRTGEKHPRDAKMHLAHTLTAMYHGRAAADVAQEAFVAVHQRGALPEEMEDVVLDRSALDEGAIGWARLLVTLGMQPSMAEAKRTIASGGCYLNGIRLTDASAPIVVGVGDIVQVGKRTHRRIVLG
ncbi:MAG: tyrosine--tRNA ligase [Paenibacillaceae bacterium]|nr:tyrosine--tRNA ligase [Paenibacillaceae bacterium]